ncbi:hypothetical protein NPIL_158981, partial [Nephila pilipes]
DSTKREALSEPGNHLSWPPMDDRSINP